MKRRKKWRGIAVGAAMLAGASAAGDPAHAGGCPDDEIESAIAGGMLGVYAGAAAAAGAMAFLSPLGLLGSAWLFLTGGECAGAISVDEDDRFHMSWDRDSDEEARKDNLEYCRQKSGDSCTLLAVFRHCAAVAVDRNAGVFGVGTARTASGADRNALQECVKHGGERKNCDLALSAKCNSG